MPYTGTFEEYGATGQAEAAYFRMINERGGVNGRKISFVTVDSGSNMAKSTELARKLVEQDHVLLLFSVWGSKPNRAIRAYMNQSKVPQIFLAANDDAFDDPANFPWTMGFAPSKRTEGVAYAKYILRTKPGAKIGVLYSNDDAGKEWLGGVHAGLGEKAATSIVKEISFEYFDPAGIDEDVVALKNSGADVFVNMTVGKFATQTIRKAYDIGWRPLEIIPNASISVTSFLEPAGLEKAVGIVTSARSKRPTDAASREDPAVREYLDWMKKYDSTANVRDANVLFGYEAAETMVAVLKQCGDDLTRENVMKQAASLDLELGMLVPGIRVTTSATDYRPIKQLILMRFDGRVWVPFGDVIGE